MRTSYLCLLQSDVLCWTNECVVWRQDESWSHEHKSFWEIRGEVMQCWVFLAIGAIYTNCSMHGFLSPTGLKWPMKVHDVASVTEVCWYLGPDGTGQTTLLHDRARTTEHYHLLSQECLPRQGHDGRVVEVHKRNATSKNHHRCVRMIAGYVY